MYLSIQLSSSKAAAERIKAEQGFRPRGLQGQTLDLGAQLGGRDQVFGWGAQGRILGISTN